MTPSQDALLQQLLRALGEDSRVQAVWLSGSLGRGEGDAWSDVDLVVQVPEAEVAACVADYKAGRPGLPQAVLAFDVYGVVVSAVTERWERFDIHFASPAQVGRMDRSGWKPLVGAPLAPPAAPKSRSDDGAPERLRALVTEFLRVLGLSPAMAAREEWIVGQQGFELLRRMLVDLMLEENGAARAARGAKRLNAFLTPEQRAELEAIVPPRSNRDALLTGDLALARAFLPRARLLADRLGAAWPEQFEEATRRHLESTLGLRL
jgi:predicted nucleotidyltransferase